MTTDDTLARVDTEANLRAALEAKRRRLLEEHQRAARLNAPLRDPVTVAALAELAEDARMKRAEAESLRLIGAKTYRTQIHKLEADARKLDEKAEKLRREELEQDRLYGEAKEPILMAKARGEEVDARDVETAEVAVDEFGAPIIHKRGPNKGFAVMKYSRGTRAKKVGGLDWLWLKERIDEDQMGAGIRYGDEYRLANDISLKSCIAGGVGGGGGAAQQEIRADAQSAIRRARDKGLSNHAEMVWICDQVAGEGVRIRALSHEDDSEAARLEATLKIALDLLAKYYGTAKR